MAPYRCSHGWDSDHQAHCRDWICYPSPAPHNRRFIVLQASLLQTARELSLFAGLEDEQTAQLLAGAELKDHPAERMLFTEGELPDFLHILVEGIVELYTGQAPRECGLMLLFAGDVFMPAATLFNEPYINSARALTPARILLLRADVIRTQFANSLPLAINFSRVLAGQFRMATRQIIDLKSLSAAQRLAAFLLRLVDARTGLEGARLPVSKRHLASRLGVTPETLSRAIQLLAENGLLLRGTRIVVRDRARIDAFCGSPPYPPAERGLDVNLL